MQEHLLTVIRYVIGYVFISSGVVKLMVPSFIDVFYNLGLPFPIISLFLVAVIEIACGALIVGKVYIKYATIPLIIIMIGALFIAKFPIFFKDGILSFIFESRLDIAMLLLLIFLWRYREAFVQE